MIQALFFDLDGTLLTSKKRISDETLRDLRALHASGIKLFPATGRSRDLHLSLGFTDEILSLFEGGVYANGGVVEIGKRTEYMKLNPSSVKGILGEVAKYKDIHASLHLADGKCAFNFTLSKAFYSPWG
ncbi:MAG: HAD family phosphatase, partial [Clostridia bacterium]|nr:HAD family phosphatase [Clostridia bacterium]